MENRIAAIRSAFVGKALTTAALLIAFAAFALFGMAACTSGGQSSSENAPVHAEVTDEFAPADAGFYTAMGTYPAGALSVKLYPADAALSAYLAEHPDGSTESFLSAWADSVDTATLGGIELAKRDFKEWIYEMQGPEADVETLRYFGLDVSEEYATLTVPVAFFDITEGDSVVRTLVMDSAEFGTLKTDIAYHNNASTTLTVRVVDRPATRSNYEVLYETELTLEDLQSLEVLDGYETTANCGMAGLRTFYNTGVYLSDVLELCGITFAEGMELQARTTDYLLEAGDTDASYSSYYSDAGKNDAGYYCGYDSNGTYSYDYLYGQPRYNYPAMWDDETVYDELGGKTVYQMLAADKDAWKTDDDTAVALARILGETKEQIEPIIAFSWNQGVVAWGGTDPKTQSYGDYQINPYSAYGIFGLRYGLTAEEDGSISDDNQMMKSPSELFGIDIIDPTGTAVQ